MDGHAPHEHITEVGLGLFPVCVLSESLELRVRRDGRQYSQRFARGLAVSKLQDEGLSDNTGTRITFAPDPEIFPPLLDSTLIHARLQELAYFLPKLTIAFADRRQHIFHEPRGLLACLDAHSRADIHQGATFVAVGSIKQIAVEAVMRWRSSGSPPLIESFANLQKTTNGGTHIRGLILGLVAGLRRVSPKRCAERSLRELERAVSRSLVAIVCVRLEDPRFESPTRNRLCTPAAKLAVRKCVAEAFPDFLKKEIGVLDRILSEVA